MTAPNLFGPPSNTALQQLNMKAAELSFNKGADPVQGIIGQDGCPDPSKDPMACYRYLNGMRDIIKKAANQEPLIRLADKDLNVLTEITGEMAASVEELMADSGQATVIIRYDHWIEDYVINGVTITEDLHLLIDPIPTQQDWRIRWGGKVKDISVVNNEDGTSTITFLALSHREHMKKLLFGAAPWFPPEFQLPRMWILPGPIRSVFFITGMVNLARLFFPGLNVITNLFNPGAWLSYLDPNNWLNFNPLSWPIQIAFVDPITDTSMWTVLAATWTDWHSTMADPLSNAGCMVRAYTWLTTDLDSPHTALSDLLEAGDADQLSAVTGLTVEQLYEQAQGNISNLARPTRNCVILDCQDKSGRVGPTGTALDGLLELIGVTLDDMITDVLVDQQSMQVLDGEEVIDTTQINQFFSQIAGVHIPAPHVIWREGQFTGMVHREVNLHKGAPLTMMVGGRSPTIVNELQCVAGDTLVEGPDGDDRIDVLAASGGPFRIWSITPAGERVSAWATHAFKKGIAELFEYTLDDGRSIRATRQHRFLTNCGYISGADICCGSKVATADHRMIDSACSTPKLDDVVDSQYENMGETEALRFREVVKIRSVGVHDFYDMQVPGWKNYSANGFWNHNTFGIKYALAELSMVPTLDENIGFFSGPGSLNQQMPATPGLDSLYQGQLDNILLAWERYTSPVRELHAGELAYQEYIERGSSSAYTLASWLSLAEANWKTRPFYGFQSKALNGRPWVYGLDFALGDRVGFEMDGIIFVDQLAAVKWQYDRQTPNFLMISVGDDRNKHDPIAAGMQALQGVYSLVGAFLGEGTLFG